MKVILGWFCLANFFLQGQQSFIPTWTKDGCCAACSFVTSLRPFTFLTECSLNGSQQYFFIFFSLRSSELWANVDIFSPSVFKLRKTFSPLYLWYGIYLISCEVINIPLLFIQHIVNLWINIWFPVGVTHCFPAFQNECICDIMISYFISFTGNSTKSILA